MSQPFGGLRIFFYLCTLFPRARRFINEHAHARKKPKAHNLNTEKHIFTKRRFFFIAVFLIITSLLPARAVNTAYYSTLNNKSGTTLVSAITAISHGKYSGVQYGSGSCSPCVWSAYETTDVYPSTSPYAGMIWEIYAGCTSFEPRTNQGSSCGTVCGTTSGCGYNREHSLPKSWFGISSSDLTTSYRGPGVDIHHIYPTDVNVNTKRSNNPYGEVASPEYTSPNGSKKGTCTWPSGFTGTVFEPADEYKGDLARAYMYMVVTWNAYNTSTYSFTQDAAGYGAVTFNDSITSAGNYGLTAYGLALLMKWHRQDPVSQKEIDRNNAAEAVQGNRNPFVDYPCLAEYLWGNKKDQTFKISEVLGSFEDGFIAGSSDGCSCSPQVTITFMPNGGTGTMPNQSVPVSTSTALNTNTYTREGYDFAGWAESTNGNVVYEDGDIINTDADKTLYAQWTPKPTLTITFMNGAAVFATQSGYSGQVISIDTPAACEGYTFVGWSTHEYGATNTTTPVIDFDGTVPATATTYHAVFSRNEGDGTYVLTNNYKRITTLNELTDGNYIVAGYYNSGYYAMKNAIQSNYYIATATVSPDANNVISNPDNSLVWAVTMNGTTATFYNEAAAKYLYTYISGNYRNIGLTDTNSDTGFTMSVSDGAWTLQGNATSYYVQYDGSYNDYTIKKATGTNPIYLYKQQSELTGTTYYTTSTTCQCTVTAESSNEAQGTTGVQSL